MECEKIRKKQQSHLEVEPSWSELDYFKMFTADLLKHRSRIDTMVNMKHVEKVYLCEKDATEFNLTKEEVITSDSHNIDSIIESLKDRYRRKDAYMLSLLGEDDETTYSIQDFYVNLKLEEKDLEGVFTKDKSILLNDIFKTKDHPIPKYKRDVLITADAGFGKTALAIKLSYDWGSIYHQDYIPLFDVVVNIPLISIGNNTIRDSVKNAMEIDEETFQKFISWKRNWLIILDGFDEIDDTANVVAFLEDPNGVFGKYGRLNLTIVLTSRPHAIRNIIHFFDRHISILGISPEDQRSYIETMFSHKQDQVEKMIEIINKDAFLRSASECPLLLHIICCVYRNEQNETIPIITSRTMLYRKVIKLLTARHVNKYSESRIPSGIKDSDVVDNDLLIRLGRIAGKALRPSTLITESVLRETFPKTEEYNVVIGVGILLALPTRCSSKVVTDYRFFHRSFAEFFEALYIVDLAKRPESNADLVDALPNTDNLETAMFVAGIFGKDIRQYNNILLWATKNRKNISEFIKIKQEATIDVKSLEQVCSFSELVKESLKERYRNNDASAVPLLGKGEGLGCSLQDCNFMMEEKDLTGACTKTSRISLNQIFEAKNEEVSHLAQNILVTADAGFGKTLLVAKLLFDWALPEPLHYMSHFDIVLNIPLITTVNQKICELIINTLEIDEKTFKEFMSMEKQWLIVLDGFDEIKDITKISEFLEKSKDCRSATVILTSRSYVINDIIHFFVRHLSIARLDTIDQKRLFINVMFSWKLDEIERMIEIIEKDPILCKISESPLLLSNICHVYRDELRKSKLTTISQTLLYRNVFHLLITRYMNKHSKSNVIALKDITDNDLFFRIGKIGNRFLRHSNCITEGDLQEMFLEKEDYEVFIGMGIVLVIPIIHNNVVVKKYEFLHHSFAEFLEAIYIVHLVKRSESNVDLKETLPNSNNFGTAKFVAGLFGRSGYKYKNVFTWIIGNRRTLRELVEIKEELGLDAIYLEKMCSLIKSIEESLKERYRKYDTNMPSFLGEYNALACLLHDYTFKVEEKDVLGVFTKGNNIHLNQIFDRGNEEASYLVQNILVTADAGLGENFLATKLLFDWASSEPPSYISHFDIAVNIPLITISSHTILESIINSIGIDKDTFEGFMSMKKRWLIILDGFDEMDDVNNALKFLELSNILFKNCEKLTVIVTSRPFAIIGIQHLFHRHLSILGLSTDNKKKYIEAIFRTNCEQVKKVTSIIENNSFLSKISECPLVLRIICFVYGNKCYRPISNIISRTMLYEELLKTLIICYENKYDETNITSAVKNSNIIENDIFVRLGKIAWDSLQNFHFITNDVLHEMLPNEEEYAIVLKTGILFPSSSSTADNSYKFIFRSISDFFKAIYIAALKVEKPTNTSSETVLQTINDFSTALFVAGLLGKEIFNCTYISSWIKDNIQNLSELIEIKNEADLDVDVWEQCSSLILETEYNNTPSERDLLCSNYTLRNFKNINIRTKEANEEFWQSACRVISKAISKTEFSIEFPVSVVYYSPLKLPIQIRFINMECIMKELISINDMLREYRSPYNIQVHIYPKDIVSIRESTVDECEIDVKPKSEKIIGVLATSFCSIPKCYNSDAGGKWEFDKLVIHYGRNVGIGKLEEIKTDAKLKIIPVLIVTRKEAKIIKNLPLAKNFYIKVVGLKSTSMSNNLCDFMTPTKFGKMSSEDFFNGWLLRIEDLHNNHTRDHEMINLRRHKLFWRDDEESNLRRIGKRVCNVI